MRLALLALVSVLLCAACVTPQPGSPAYKNQQMMGPGNLTPSIGGGFK